VKELGEMKISPIRTKANYKSALTEVSKLVDLDPKAGTPNGDSLEVLSILIEEYESKHFPIESPNPIDAICFRMEQNDLTAKDLVPLIGNLNRVYEILNGKRSLTLKMIRNITEELGIPAKVLIQ
jgi:HTH-type transcriptional regulator/antitoxin HigA